MDVHWVEGIKILNLVLIGNELILLDWGLLILKVLLMALKRALWKINVWVWGFFVLVLFHSLRSEAAHFVNEILGNLYDSAISKVQHVKIS